MKNYLMLTCACAVTLTIVACSGKTENNAANQPESVAVMSDEQTTAEQPVAATATENPLLAAEVQEMYELSMSDADDEQKQKTMHLVNRIMSMLNATQDQPELEWLWYDAVNVAMQEYATAAGRKADVASVLADINEILAPLSAGAQFEMNQYAYIDSNLKLYETLGAYHALQNSAKDAEMKSLIYAEFVAWCAWRNDLQKKYTEYDLGDDWYSMKPMEISSNYYYLCDQRLKMLQEEQRLWAGKTDYQQRQATVKGSQWNEWLEPLGDFAAEMKESFGNWRDVRVKIQKQLGGEAGKAYDKMTADLHAMALIRED